MKRCILSIKKSFVLGCALSLFAVAPVIASGEGSKTNVFAQSSGSWLWELLNHWFGRVDDEEESGSEEGSKPINNGNPVPTISDTDNSKDFLKERIAEEALTDHGVNYAVALEAYGDYSGGLAKTLSQLSPEEQQKIFYGN